MLCDSQWTVFYTSSGNFLRIGWYTSGIYTSNPSVLCWTRRGRGGTNYAAVINTCPRKTMRHACSRCRRPRICSETRRRDKWRTWPIPRRPPHQGMVLNSAG